jgi:hypothetical protein
VIAFHRRAEKSALAVAPCVAGAFSVAPHTHPLCPSNVPIQSPVSPFRSIGWPSLLLEIKNTPSSVTSLYSRFTIGRECPWHTSGAAIATAQLDRVVVFCLAVAIVRARATRAIGSDSLARGEEARTTSTS